MFRIRAFLLSAIAILALIQPLPAQTAATAEDPAHQELRALRDDLLAGVSKGDIDAMITRMDPAVIITWQNGEVCRGHEGVRAFYARLAASTRRTFQGYKVPPTADELTILHAGGQTGVVYGHNTGRYFLLGKEIELPNRWTATVVKKDGRWLLASYHISMNVLDNPILTGVKRGALITGTLALVIGLLGGWWMGRRSRQPGA